MTLIRKTSELEFNPRFKGHLTWLYTVQFVNMWFALYSKQPLPLFDNSWTMYEKFQLTFESDWIKFYDYYRGTGSI